MDYTVDVPMTVQGEEHSRSASAQQYWYPVVNEGLVRVGCSAKQPVQLPHSFVRFAVQASNTRFACMLAVLILLLCRGFAYESDIAWQSARCCQLTMQQHLSLAAVAGDASL